MAESKPASAVDIDSGADAVLETGFTDAQRDASTLMRAAGLLTDAEGTEEVGAALAHNLKLWVAIRSIANSERCELPEELRSELRTLAKYTADITIPAREGTIDLRDIIALARIDLMIAEGLLNAERNALIQKRAYEIWEEEGRPVDKSAEHWLRAERDVALAAAGLSPAAGG